MDDEIEMVSDGEGLAVVGEPHAVEKALRSVGLWDESTAIDFGRIKGFLGAGGHGMQVAAELSASSARWVKLTEKSAQLKKLHGLMKSKVDGESHLMVGVPGEISSWLQTEDGAGSLLTNPAVLSGVGTLMSQVASQQAIAQITSYLDTISVNVGDLLRKQDSAVVASMVGVGAAIDRAMTLRDGTGEIDETTWSAIAQAHTTIGATQSYALDELDAIAKTLESTKVGDLADSARKAKPEAQKWLAVLARCFQLHEEADVLELDRRIDQSSDKLDAYRLAMRADRDRRRALISEHTGQLLGRMDRAVGRANETILWTRVKSLTVVESGNHVAGRVDRFHDSLGIEAPSRSWEPRQLGPGEEFGSQAVQKGRDALPYAGSAAGVVLTVLAARKKVRH